MLTTQASAGCPSGFDPFTTCDIIGRGTMVSVCHDNNTVTYSCGTFGEAPELTLSETIKDIDYNPWIGPGALSGSVTLDGSSCRKMVKHWIDLSVSPGQPDTHMASGIYEGKVAAGLIWDGDENGWVPLPD